MACSKVMNVRTMIDRTSIFNELPSLHESNTRLSMQLASMGERSDLAELKYVPTAIAREAGLYDILHHC